MREIFKGPVAVAVAVVVESFILLSTQHFYNAHLVFAKFVKLVRWMGDGKDGLQRQFLGLLLDKQQRHGKYYILM